MLPSRAVSGFSSSVRLRLIVACRVPMRVTGFGERARFARQAQDCTAISNHLRCTCTSWRTGGYHGMAGPAVRRVFSFHMETYRKRKYHGSKRSLSAATCWFREAALSIYATRLGRTTATNVANKDNPMAWDGSAADHLSARQDMQIARFLQARIPIVVMRMQARGVEEWKMCHLSHVPYHSIGGRLERRRRRQH